MNHPFKIGSTFLWMTFLFAISFHNLNAQCAGTDNTITVCNKDADTTIQNFDLFTNLGGTPVTGGMWSTNNPANFFALDATTGMVNLWKITNSGIHEFTYTNDTCSQSATVTINLGGYPGEDNIDGSANACSDNSAVNLHGFLGSNVDDKVQDFNGLWEEDPSTATGFLSANIFNAEEAGPGIYIFTHTVPQVDVCASRTATVILEVHPAANPGTPSELIVCTNEDLAPFTNLNLNDYLSGQDANGTWSENGTNQLSDLTDSFINVEQINTNFGHDVYEFTYTVFPSHPVCDKNSSTVKIIILPALDGTMTPPNFCIGTPYSVPLSYDDSILPNGEYRISYQLDNSGSLVDFDDVVLSDGLGTIQLNANLVPINEFVSIDIIDIVGINPDRPVCSTILVPQASFLVSDALVSVEDICDGESTLVSFSNILNSSGSFSNTSYDINYSLTDSNGLITSHSVTEVDFTNGVGTLPIPSEYLSVAGSYDVTFDILGSFDIDCDLQTSFMLIPIPEPIQLDLLVNNNCNASQIDVIVDAPVLPDGNYQITYDVTELNSTEVLTTNTITFNGGNANYQINVAALPQGNYTASVRSTQNDTTPCRTIFDFEERENFAIQGIPSIPEASAEQTFCLSEFEATGPTLEDIEVTANGEILFYATATDTDILPLTETLVDGEDYFVSNTDLNNNCEGSERIQIGVSLVNPQAPTSITLNPVFCASDAPTLTDFSVVLPNNGVPVWFETAEGGTPLTPDTTLEHGKSYFAANQIDGQCLSSVRLEFIPTVIGLEPVSLEFTQLALCGLDSPTVNNLRELEINADNEVLWYDQPENGSALADTVLLEENITYYAESFNPDTGCINPNRIAVTVELSNCEPQEYDFFIPDGFSPNGDGRNDTFFIPNIEIIFPEFTLEILNRYGTSLFKGDQANPAWDGRNGSGIAPNGVYFYIINYNKEGFEPVQGRLYLNQ